MSWMAVGCDGGPRAVAPPDAPGVDGASDVGSDLTASDLVASDGATAEDEGPPGAPSRGALACDGVDDEVRVDVRGLFDRVASFTIELRFRASSVLPHGQPPEFLLAAPGADVFRDEFSVALRDGFAMSRTIGALMHYARDDDSCGGANALGAGAIDPPEVGRWYHFAMTFQSQPGGTMRTALFIDGHTRGPSESAGRRRPCVAPSALLLCHGAGTAPTLWRPYVGQIDDVRISEGVRYTRDFSPRTHDPDARTLVLLDFEDGPIRDRGSSARAVTTAGSPARVSLP